MPAVDGEVESSPDPRIVERRQAGVEPRVLRLGQDPRAQPRPDAGAQRGELTGGRIAGQLRDVQPIVLGRGDQGLLVVDRHLDPIGEARRAPVRAGRAEVRIARELSAAADDLQVDAIRAGSRRRVGSERQGRGARGHDGHESGRELLRKLRIGTPEVEGHCARAVVGGDCPARGRTHRDLSGTGPSRGSPRRSAGSRRWLRTGFAR